MQQEDAATALAADDVFERPLLVLDERLDEHFALGREHQLLLGLVVLLYLVHVVNGQFSPLFARERETLDRGPAAL